MVAGNGKSVMKLLRLPILRLLIRKRDILYWFQCLKNLKDLYIGWQGLPHIFL